VKLASYKATRPGLPGLFNRVVRWWLHGEYSHCELVFSDGASFSCSKLDGGPRFKYIKFDPAHWDFVPVPARYNEDAARNQARAIVADQSSERVRYSMLLLAAFVLPPLYRWVRDRDEVCSTIIGWVLGRADSKRLDPNELHDALLIEGRQ
jgi:hypothetical protein